tara:strand:- start:481 stop:705 length:225 start_codon:yes stop_codon:yes gene_type:complete
MIKILRWGLRLHSIFHFAEFISAIYESAFITASIAFTAALIEILASIYLPNEHVHFKGLISDVHEKCDDKKIDE